MLRVLSLGGGVQSVTIAFMVKHGELPPIDCAIFADTRRERRATLDYLEWMTPLVPFPIHTVSRGDLWESATRVKTTRDGQRTYVETGVPVFTVDGLKRGLGKRQCTRTFKIEPVNSKIRELIGKRRILSREPVVEVLFGITTDEAYRMRSASELAWMAPPSYPLIEKNMARPDCAVWLERKGYPIPPRSSCKECPFHSDDEWAALTPEEFAGACKSEKQLQDAYARASAIHSVPYLHESRVPLSEVKLRPTGGRDAARQLSMFNNECTGFCGV